MFTATRSHAYANPMGLQFGSYSQESALHQDQQTTNFNVGQSSYHSTETPANPLQPDIVKQNPAKIQQPEDSQDIVPALIAMENDAAYTAGDSLNETTAFVDPSYNHVTEGGVDEEAYIAGEGVDVEVYISELGMDEDSYVAEDGLDNVVYGAEELYEGQLM
ncbi:uncharacterized protein Z519_01737 [Cladophialophora bantiana CBS 173.52]|uniref:Uncharacterized protein n=1 Tax=Cladophialophora bantiana (strain ATCC 10958 / CBS 173.52 / CDC B-1940 / NIH 8579) TaxID=1442370 RepID=A0A0D2HXM6_CLAB1|nr:uncharacterized protein Z519_01737 [Cladophialophora bantiana CBS 173.52]KIW98153.1 hypothetical protein Z519_01737 [Cladophialophora bantiana CBS 173.52]